MDSFHDLTFFGSLALALATFPTSVARGFRTAAAPTSLFPVSAAVSVDPVRSSEMFARVISLSRNSVAAVVGGSPLSISVPPCFRLDDFAMYRFFFEDTFSKYLELKVR